MRVGRFVLYAGMTAVKLLLLGVKTLTPFKGVPLQLRWWRRGLGPGGLDEMLIDPSVL